MRAVIVLVVIALLLVAGVFGPRMLRSTGDSADAANLEECDLMASACEWDNASGAWSVQLEVDEVGDQGTEYQLTIATDSAPERFLAVLRGESMYMGEYPVLLARSSPGHYSARFTAPVCTTGADMIWRLDLQAGQKALADIPVRMVFRAPH